MKLNAINNEKGVALLSALMIMALLTVLGLSASNTSTTELKIAGNERLSAQALYAAEAGINVAIVTLNSDTSAWDSLLTDPDDPYGDNPLEDDGTVGNASYRVYIIDNEDEVWPTADDPFDDIDDTVIIRAEGTTGAGGSTKNIEVVFTIPPGTGLPNIDGGLGIYDDGGSTLDLFGGGN